MKILDHGYLRHVETWGSDAGIIEAARMSTAKGFKGWGNVTACPVHTVGMPLATVRGERRAFTEHEERAWRAAGAPSSWTVGHVGPVYEDVKLKAGDEKLLRYLYENRHSTPFEMAGLTIEVQAPILVFRQWHRHRTQSYNEMSARYTPLPDLNYRPTIDRCIVVDGKNKQAGKTTKRTPTHEEVLDWLDNYLDPAYVAAQRAYERGLEIGVPKEVARCPVPVARYSRMRASANLRNWLAFMTLRSHNHAQLEIRVFAEALGELIERDFPRTWALFVEGRDAQE